MNRISIILLASTFLGTLLAQTTTIVFPPNTNLPNLSLQTSNPSNLRTANLPSVHLPNNDDPQTTSKQASSAVSLPVNVPPANNDFRASAPIVNTNELWRMLSKLRIGSFFTSRAIKCECPSVSQPTTAPAATLIPIPMVERIHHHYDKSSSRDALNGLRKAAYDLKYPYDVRNARNLYDLSETAKQAAHGLSGAEASSSKKFDKARFGELSDLISDNGQRSIMSAVRAPSFGNQQSASLPPISLQDAQSLLLNAGAMRELSPLLADTKEPQYRSAPRNQQASMSKDELAHNLAWLDESLNALNNNPDKQLPLFSLVEGRLDVQNALNPSRPMNEMARLLLNELESPSRQNDPSGSYSSRIKILRLLGDLERLMAQNEKWSGDRRSPVDYKLADARRLSGRLSSRFRDDLLTDSFTNGGMLANRLNQTAGGHRFSSAFKQAIGSSNRPNNKYSDWDDVDTEYFSDVTDYLPSESVAKFDADQAKTQFDNRTAETDFYPIENPASLIRPPRENDNSNR